jgi:hypothetical protein
MRLLIAGVFAREIAGIKRRQGEALLEGLLGYMKRRDSTRRKDDPAGKVRRAAAIRSKLCKYGTRRAKPIACELAIQAGNRQRARKCPANRHFRAAVKRAIREKPVVAWEIQ